MFAYISITVQCNRFLIPSFVPLLGLSLRAAERRSHPLSIVVVVVVVFRHCSRRG